MQFLASEHVRRSALRSLSHKKGKTCVIRGFTYSSAMTFFGDEWPGDKDPG
jgi:hypothetical protein